MSSRLFKKKSITMHGNMNAKHVTLTLPTPVREAMIRVYMLKGL